MSIRWALTVLPYTVHESDPNLSIILRMYNHSPPLGTICVTYECTQFSTRMRLDTPDHSHLTSTFLRGGRAKWSRAGLRLPPTPPTCNYLTLSKALDFFEHRFCPLCMVRLILPHKVVVKSKWGHVSQWLSKSVTQNDDSMYCYLGQVSTLWHPSHPPCLSRPRVDTQGKGMFCHCSFCWQNDILALYVSVSLQQWAFILRPMGQWDGWKCCAINVFLLGSSLKE